MSYRWKGRWTGINIPTLTCFTPDQEVDYEATRALFRYLVGVQGVAGIAVNVHTGEGEVLTEEERIKVVEVATQEINGKFPLITGIHADNAKEGVRQAKEMAKLGVDGLMILAPNIYVWDAREEPEFGIEHHKAIAKSVNLPFVMHQVYGTAHEYPTEALAKMFREIPNLIAVKLATSQATFAKFEKDCRALREIPRDNISLFAGSKHFLTFLWGVDGAWSGQCNFLCEKSVALFNAVRLGNLDAAKKLRDQLHIIERVLYIKPMVNLMTRYKEAASMLGVIPSPIVRPPKLPLRDTERDEILSALKAADMLPKT